MSIQSLWEHLSSLPSAARTLGQPACSARDKLSAGFPVSARTRCQHVLRYGRHILTDFSARKHACTGSILEAELYSAKSPRSIRRTTSDGSLSRAVHIWRASRISQAVGEDGNIAGNFSKRAYANANKILLPMEPSKNRASIES